MTAIRSAMILHKKLSQPSEDEAEIVAGGGEDGIGLVAIRPSPPCCAAFEVIALEVAF